MGLEISSGKATTPAAWLIRPPQVMSEPDYRKVIIIVCSQEWNLTVRTTAGLWLHAEIIMRSSNRRRKPHDELILFFNILLIRPSKRLLSSSGQLTVGTRLKINIPLAKLAWQRSHWENKAKLRNGNGVRFCGVEKDRRGNLSVHNIYSSCLFWYRSQKVRKNTKEASHLRT